jgi:hypothetical protein
MPADMISTIRIISMNSEGIIIEHVWIKIPRELY